MRLTLGQVAHALDLVTPVDGPNLLLTGAAIDSRQAKPGDLFFCLSGVRVDGHDFAAQAVANGAAAVVAAQALPEVQGKTPVLTVRDNMTVQDALGRVGFLWRNLFAGRVVGVTGTAGKTTVKEMLARVCAQAGETSRNRMNWNNQIGLPLSLLECTGAEGFWVMEAGISRPGDMDELGTILRPDLAIVLNAGPAHLLELGDVARVAGAKARLTRYLTKNGMALVNQDCPDLWRECTAYTQRIHGFSMHDRDAEFFCEEPFCLSPSSVGLKLRLRGRPLEVSWPVEKAPIAQNVLAVAAAATLLGIKSAAIREALQAEDSLPGRFVVEQHGAWLLVDDTYNANPLSMHMALHRARSLAGQQPLICVLGDMLELGTAAAAEHAKLGRSLAGVCTDVFYHGHHAGEVLAGLKAEESRARFLECDSPKRFIEGWRASVRAQAKDGEMAVETVGAMEGGVVLFKGSRAGQMETYLHALQKELRT
ncbi:MAG: UDP-N-acetylmuramoyl-tripeptide--D-alanyl-D-alanine ligase [Desulfovibrionales bacterium]|nr:MAG: UDP-N-acetylmuramoyl-tripeptide--D-alanyl-D-alanine ligase [Desulfovibrionales bacterium]